MERRELAAALLGFLPRRGAEARGVIGGVTAVASLPFLSPPWLTFLFSFLVLAACSEPMEPPPPISSILAPASPPPIYDDFTDIEPLFQQRNDTTYLINFWATWCKPCLEELPLLQELQEKTPGAFRVVLVSLDTEAGAIERLPAYLEARKINLPTVVLTDERPTWFQVFDPDWKGALPTTVIYRNELRYVYRRAFNTLPDVTDAVTPLLR